MNDQQLMRMALVLQNQAATSLEKNLCSIVTVVLLDSQVVSYIYHSFNTNTNNLLYLLKYRSIPEDAKFNATNEEISALNDFLNWEDKEKNEIIYILVSVCFEYCMLTVKKE